MILWKKYVLLGKGDIYFDNLTLILTFHIYGKSARQTQYIHKDLKHLKGVAFFLNFHSLLRMSRHILSTLKLVNYCIMCYFVLPLFRKIRQATPSLGPLWQYWNQVELLRNKLYSSFFLSQVDKRQKLYRQILRFQA